jgi:hypothetical protein
MGAKPGRAPTACGARPVYDRVECAVAPVLAGSNA